MLGCMAMVPQGRMWNNAMTKPTINIIDEDSIHLLDEGKSLELIQFDLIGENESTCMHGMLATVF